MTTTRTPRALRDHFERAVALALDEDLAGNGIEADVTTVATVPDHAVADAEVIAKQDGVIAGIDALDATFHRLDPAVAVERCVHDGDPVRPGVVVASLHGPARPILTGERTALNLLGHLSGIATLVRSFVREAPGTMLVDTRKTLPGLRALQKYAVACGGGANHRMALWDGVLVKDNHIVVAGGVAEATRLAKQATSLPVQVEVTTSDEAAAAVDAGADALLLDNFAPDAIRQAVERVRAMGRDILVEASGGVTLETVSAVAATGVDRISVGAFTHSAPGLDVSLEVRRTSAKEA